uniref:Uncharacterized protein n=1 Tax=Arundo donax TaxID=35708 RepID=A0A0A8YCY2_ARUDO
MLKLSQLPRRVLRRPSTLKTLLTPSQLKASPGDMSFPVFPIVGELF